MSRSALFIDTSYYIFHRFFATHRWYSFQQKEVAHDGCTVLSDEVFLTAFVRHLQNDFKTFRKLHAGADIWMMLDCPRKDIWRMKIYPKYKETRKHADCFDGGIFPIALEHIRKMDDIRFVQHPALEADDLCYIFQREFVATGKYTHITILANDNDYLQMVSENVCIMNKEGKNIASRGTGNPRHDVLKKILTGDKSDNIPPICAGIGSKTADKLLAMNDEDRETWIRTKGASAWDQYLINLRLIELSHIPQEYVDEVVENLKEKEI